jgi:adenylate kinase family enzyme
MPVPKRILILGPSGAGKSTLARHMGKRLGLPVVHLDAFNWNPGWVQTEAGQFRQRVAEAAACDAWVMEGNYLTSLDLRLPRAEAVIWLDLPRYVYFSRAVWRSIRNYGRDRDDLGPGIPSSSICRSCWTGCGIIRPVTAHGMRNSCPICQQEFRESC